MNRFLTFLLALLVADLAVADGTNGTNAVRESLDLLSKAKQSLQQTSNAAGEDQARIAAYRAAWSQCLQTMKKSEDQATHRLVLDEWNRCLRDDDSSVPSQVSALAEQWDRNLLTEDFYQLLKKTNNKKTIAAIAYAFYEHGNATDADQLMQIRKSGIDIESQEIVQNAINWMNYRLSGNNEDLYPAAFPPRKE